MTIIDIGRLINESVVWHNQEAYKLAALTDPYLITYIALSPLVYIALAFYAESLQLEQYLNKVCSRPRALAPITPNAPLFFA
jgi:hypothetical protein